jgi:predicted enzyme related to lactoylglutathione lyase
LHAIQYCYFSVARLAETRVAVLEAGACIVENIARMPWGEQLFYERDVSGNPISFVSVGTMFLWAGVAETSTKAR